jgi:hypothetical protein
LSTDPTRPCSSAVLDELRQLPQLLFVGELRRTQKNTSGQQPTANGQHAGSLQRFVQFAARHIF